MLFNYSFLKFKKKIEVDLVKVHLQFTTKSLLLFSHIYFAFHYKNVAILYESFTSLKRQWEQYNSIIEPGNS